MAGRPDIPALRQNRTETMTRQALFPAGSRIMADRIRLSPGIVSGNHVFVTGMTGSSPDGTLPDRLADQFRQAF